MILSFPSYGLTLQIILFCITNGSGRPIIEETLEFLQHYGYLSSKSQSSIAVNGRQSGEGIRTALLTFQRFYRLNATGELDGATLELIRAPRCGNPDDAGGGHMSPRDRNHGNHHRRVRRYSVDDRTKIWPKKLLKYRIATFPSKELSHEQVKGILRLAFNMWSVVADIDFEESMCTRSCREADIVILFGRRHHGDSIPFDGPGKVLAHAYYPAVLDIISRAGDMHFDNDELWVYNSSKGINLLSVALHELGHSLGLAHSNVEASIMYPYYLTPREGTNVRLDADDVKGIQYLYGLPSSNKTLPSAVIPTVDDRQSTDAIDPYSPDDTPDAESPFDTDDAKKFCNITVDAVVRVRSLELHIFSGRWVWRMIWSRTVSNWFSYEFRDGPAAYFYYWPVLPNTLDGVDTILEADDGRIWVFKGQRFWVLTSNTALMSGVPEQGLPLHRLGLATSVRKVDSLFQWSDQRQIYLFAGDHFWRFFPDRGVYGEAAGRADGYPRAIGTVWRGLATPIDAAFTKHTGETYFFQGNQYYSFNNYRMAVRPGYPQTTNLPWLGCKHHQERKVHELFGSG